jgi:hypothetical protein
MRAKWISSLIAGIDKWRCEGFCPVVWHHSSHLQATFNFLRIIPCSCAALKSLLPYLLPYLRINIIFIITLIPTLLAPLPSLIRSINYKFISKDDCEEVYKAVEGLFNNEKGSFTIHYLY